MCQWPVWTRLNFRTRAHPFHKSLVHQLPHTRTHSVESRVPAARHGRPPLLFGHHQSRQHCTHLRSLNLGLSRSWQLLAANGSLLPSSKLAVPCGCPMPPYYCFSFCLSSSSSSSSSSCNHLRFVLLSHTYTPTGLRWQSPSTSAAVLSSLITHKQPLRTLDIEYPLTLIQQRQISLATQRQTSTRSVFAFAIRSISSTALPDTSVRLSENLDSKTPRCISSR